MSEANPRRNYLVFYVLQPEGRYVFKHVRKDFADPLQDSEVDEYTESLAKFSHAHCEITGMTDLGPVTIDDSGAVAL